METISQHPQPRTLDLHHRRLAHPLAVCLITFLLLLCVGCFPTSENDDWEAARYHGLMLWSVLLTTEQSTAEQTNGRECDCTDGDCNCSEDCSCNHCRPRPTTSVTSQPEKQVLYFTASWCAPCLHWQREVLPALRSRGWDEEWITLIDIDRRLDLRRKFNIHTVPAFVVIQDDQELDRRTGTISAIDFADWVNEL